MKWLMPSSVLVSPRPPPRCDRVGFAGESSMIAYPRAANLGRGFAREADIMVVPECLLRDESVDMCYQLKWGPGI